MSKRYFYIDPLAAAWMAKYHCMRFVNLMAYCLQNDIKMGDWFPFEGFPSEDTGIRGAEFKNLPMDSFHKIYISSDSAHLLEPRIDDLCAYENFSPGSYSYLYAMHGDVGAERSQHFSHIIKRAGRQFFWPQNEETGE